MEDFSLNGCWQGEGIDANRTITPITTTDLFVNGITSGKVISVHFSKVLGGCNDCL